MRECLTCKGWLRWNTDPLVHAGAVGQALDGDGIRAADRRTVRRCWNWIIKCRKWDCFRRLCDRLNYVR